jgi:hypothetical protein
MPSTLAAAVAAISSPLSFMDMKMREKNLFPNLSAPADEIDESAERFTTIPLLQSAPDLCFALIKFSFFSIFLVRPLMCEALLRPRHNSGCNKTMDRTTQHSNQCTQRAAAAQIVSIYRARAAAYPLAHMCV